MEGASRREQNPENLGVRSCISTSDRHLAVQNVEIQDLTPPTTREFAPERRRDLLQGSLGALEVFSGVRVGGVEREGAFEMGKPGGQILYFNIRSGIPPSRMLKYKI